MNTFFEIHFDTWWFERKHAMPSCKDVDSHELGAICKGGRELSVKSLNSSSAVPSELYAPASQFSPELAIGGKACNSRDKL